MSIQSSAQQISVAINEVLSVDVVVVDDRLRRVADTFHYPDTALPIRSSSIIGRIIETGQPVMVDNKYYFQSCVDCKDRASCTMTGFMGVPIRHQGQVAGAIGLVIAEKNVRHMVENGNLIMGFLHQMADFLADKLSAQANFESMETLALERDSMLEALDTGVVLVDENGAIISYNQRFASFFGAEGIARGQKLTDHISHPLILEALSARTAKPSQTVIIPLRNEVFYGKLSCRPMWRGETFCGTALALLSLHRDDDQMPPDQKVSARDTVLRLCGTRGTRRAMELLQQYTCTREPLLIKCSTRAWTVELANAIHRESGRSGKFLLLNTFGHTDREAEQKLFGQAVSGISPYVPNAMLLAHQGTLCICNVFLMPVFLQIRIRNYLKGIVSPDGFHPDVRLLFAFSPTMESPHMHYVDQELYDMLHAREVCLPGPTENPRRLRFYLNDCAAFFSRRYHRDTVKFLPEAAAMLADSYPWTTSSRQVRQAVEYLVRTAADNVITVEQVRNLLADIGAKHRRSIHEMEQEEIQRLLQQGNTPDEICAILKISRATLYRRIKQYRSH